MVKESKEMVKEREIAVYECMRIMKVQYVDTGNNVVPIRS